MRSCGAALLLATLVMAACTTRAAPTAPAMARLRTPPRPTATPGAGTPTATRFIPARKRTATAESAALQGKAEATVTVVSTPTARPTSTPRGVPLLTPWPPDAALPVSLSLAEAEEKVAAFALPEQNQVVHRAFYTTLSDLQRAALSASDGPAAWSYGGPPEVPLWGGMGELLVFANGGVHTDSALGPIAVVEASQDGVDLGTEAFGTEVTNVVGGFNEGTATRLDSCGYIPANRRVTYAAFFDAARGSYLGHVWRDASSDWLWPVLDQVAGTPRPLATTTPSPTMAATPLAPSAQPSSSPTPPRGAKPLGVGEVPAALIDTARVMPAVNGSWWRFRTTAVSDLVVWSRSSFTVTVSSAWRLADDAMLLGGRGEAWEEPLAGMRIMLPGALVGDLQKGGLTELPEWLATPDPPAGPDPEGEVGRQSPMVNILRVPPTPGTRQNYWWWTADAPTSVDVPAGHFEGCLEARNIVSAGATHSHWFCPGVGWVRHVEYSCSSGGGWVSLAELEEYHVPEIHAVP